MTDATRRASWRSSSVQQRAPCLLAAALVVELHRQTDHVMTLLGEQGRGDRRVDASRHGNDNSHRSDRSDRSAFFRSRHGRAFASGFAACRRYPAARRSTRSISASVLSCAEAEADRVLRAMGAEAHGLQHVRRLQRSRRTRRAGRHRNALGGRARSAATRPRRDRS